MAEVPLLAVRGITKRFPGTLALDNFDLDVEAGEVHALLGENGAGKSTFIKILAGVHTSDEGRIHLAGVPLRHRGGAAAGVAFIHQDLALVELDVRDGEYRACLGLPAPSGADLLASAVSTGGGHPVELSKPISILPSSYRGCPRRRNPSSPSPAPSRRPMSASSSSMNPRPACPRRMSPASFGHWSASRSKRSE